MDDVECPYCGEGQEINHDDGHGYAEEERHEMECEECEKTFVFTTYTHHSYDPFKADCLNGKPHNTEPVKHYPPGMYPDSVRCKDCDWEDRGRRDMAVYDAWLEKGR